VNKKKIKGHDLEISLIQNSMGECLSRDEQIKKGHDLEMSLIQNSMGNA